jgi:GTP-binding protein
LNTQFDGWDPYKGEIEHRMNGAMISDRKGQATAYAIWNLQERGIMYVTHGQDVYEGMIVGEHAKDNDLEVNITREKKLTNVRASGSDEAIRLVPVRPMTLEKAMEWIEKHCDDEDFNEELMIVGQSE